MSRDLATEIAIRFLAGDVPLVAGPDLSGIAAGDEGSVWRHELAFDTTEMLSSAPRLYEFERAHAAMWRACTTDLPAITPAETMRFAEHMMEQWARVARAAEAQCTPEDMARVEE